MGKNGEILMTTLETAPGGALIEVATEKIEVQNKRETYKHYDSMLLSSSPPLPDDESVRRKKGMILVHVTEMNRLNKYGNTSNCVPKSKELLRKICFCL